MKDKNLFGEEAKAKRTPAERKVAKTDGSTHRVLDAFRNAFIARWNPPGVAEQHMVKPNMHWAADGKRAKELVASWGEEAVLETIDLFFTTTDPRVTHAWTPDYSFSHFVRMAQYLYLQRQGNGRPMDKRTATNVDAVRRALEDDDGD